MHAFAPRLVIVLVGLALALAVGAALLLAVPWSGPGDAPGHAQGDAAGHAQSQAPTTQGPVSPEAGPVAEGAAARRPPSAPSSAPPSGSAAPLRAASVLRSWDAERSAAYARGDVAALRRLYTPGSEAGRADVRLLRSYLARGLRVDGLRVQLLSVKVIGVEVVRVEGVGREVVGRGSRRPGRLRLRVVDRVARATAVDVDTGATQLLPRDVATERVVVLRRAATGAWLVASVSR